MSYQRIYDQIFSHKWQDLAQALTSEHGCISTWGGRYVYDRETNDQINLDNVCRAIFIEASKLNIRKISNEDCKAMSIIIEELERIFNESESELAKTSCTAYLVTSIFDHYIQYKDGYCSPVDKLRVIRYNINTLPS